MDKDQGPITEAGRVLLNRRFHATWTDARWAAAIVAVEEEAALLAFAEPEPDYSKSWAPKGEAGVITGPPIAGTTDTVNAGPARGEARPVSVVQSIEALGPGVVAPSHMPDAVHPVGGRQDCRYGCEDPASCEYPHVGCEHCSVARLGPEGVRDVRELGDALSRIHPGWRELL